MNLLDVFYDRQVEKQKSKIFGVMIGLVTNNQDPENQGRVKVRFPELSDNNESTWARVAVLMAGNNRGTWFPPQVDDEVLVAFEHGDIRRPIVLGALWNGRDKPPDTNANVVSFRDKKGSSLLFDAENGNIEIRAKGEVIINGTEIHLNTEGK